jgi:hypothetical protein
MSVNMYSVKDRFGAADANDDRQCEMSTSWVANRESCTDLPSTSLKLLPA